MNRLDSELSPSTMKLSLDVWKVLSRTSSLDNHPRAMAVLQAYVLHAS